MWEKYINEDEEWDEGRRRRTNSTTTKKGGEEEEAEERELRLYESEALSDGLSKLRSKIERCDVDDDDKKAKGGMSEGGREVPNPRDQVERSKSVSIPGRGP